MSRLYRRYTIISLGVLGRRPTLGPNQGMRAAAPLPRAPSVLETRRPQRAHFSRLRLFRAFTFLPTRSRLFSLCGRVPTLARVARAGRGAPTPLRDYETLNRGAALHRYRWALVVAYR